MATFQDNIQTIASAVYGKEMRPAIAEALNQSWDSVKNMMTTLDQLKARVDSLDSGGTVNPSFPDEPGASIGNQIASNVVSAFESITEAVGYAELI